MSRKRSNHDVGRRACALLVAVAFTPLTAIDVNDRLSVTTIASLAGQCEWVSAEGGDDRCEPAFVLRPSLVYRPAAAHTFAGTLAFAIGDGLNDVTPFKVTPWAADLDATIESVSGGDAVGLLTAWYRYRAEIGSSSELRLTAGIIDGTQFLDTNAYSNDEYTQFMNGALVNGPNVFVPSYEPGAAVEWQSGRWSMAGVYMRVQRTAARSSDFWGAQIAHHRRTRSGEGNYRLLADLTSPDFLDPTGTYRARLSSVLLSCDQQLGERFGVFLRIGTQSDDAAIDNRSLFSGGVDVRGATWGRPLDGIGAGYSYLTAGNTGIEYTEVTELYYRWQIVEVLAITGDLQLYREAREGAGSVGALVFGIRVTAFF